jgi:DNA-binding NarL/FixJ family response regulator
MTTNIRVLLVDDHTMLREALRLLLDNELGLKVVGELGDGSQVDEAVARLAPDVVVMDVNMPNVNGIQATRVLMAKYPKLGIVALSAVGSNQSVSEMMDAGAIAFVLKSSAGEQLVHAIKSAMQGLTYLCPDVAAIMVKARRRGSQNGQSGRNNQRLSRREVEVLRLLAQGKSSPQIGDQLYIAPGTVDVHRRNIMAKLELHGVVELTKYAMRNGLIEM